jgi:D-cysteine desulfhydrase family pyridoxal phosphate-dependent enzyme
MWYQHEREIQMSIGSQPRFRLATLPTPLQEAPRLREALGGPERCPRILIKRDDLTGLAFGGNKARKLEFLVADAINQGSTVLITTGAVQSNHARMTAAAARLAGMHSALVLTSNTEQPEVQGNLLLDRLLDAEVHLLLPESGQTNNEAMEALAEQLEGKGERPYIIPGGGSNAIGAFGYVAGSLEMSSQLFEMGASPRRLYYASGSRGTQAGLVLGAKLYGASYEVYGVAVSPGVGDRSARAAVIIEEAADKLGVPVTLGPNDLIHDEGYVGEGYGIPTDACMEAIRLVAQTEAVFLDPVYSGKAMSALIDHVRRGKLDPHDTVVFLHTGGNPALFAHGAHLL